MVEQLTLNQRVAGSSPARFTTCFNCLRTGNRLIEKSTVAENVATSLIGIGSGWVASAQILLLTVWGDDITSPSLPPDLSPHRPRIRLNAELLKRITET